MNFFKIQESPGIKFNDMEAFANQFKRYLTPFLTR